ncbi:ThiS family, putative [Synechococcus sp. PCC 7335]|uniref:MoaD/ThiS family protein n=1 Tax=Synechococcus sp. (strain ATCC 29403 / PCC 7335) TaxID=91464 RepID=UPI00017EC399|nr:MoaD/ThiS family protein [Synechococcus sp. PCC 7335]EDX85981.1 ThiS family, putative [Synechococcus sp. PCC 7335]
MSETITITLKLFAVYQETLGRSEKEMVLPIGTTAGEVRDRLITDYPTLSYWKDLTRFGINLQFATASTCLKDGDELVLIPPVSGG